MKLRVSVFTSMTAEGYKWTSTPQGVNENQLVHYCDVITSVYPEGMNKDDYLQGIIYDGSFVVIFSALRAVGFDNCGRDAKYYAAAFVNRVDWANINFDELLKNPFFHRPSRQPPQEIIYHGGESASVNDFILESFRNGGDGPRAMDFSCIGNFLSQYYYMGMDWKFYRSNSVLWHGPDVVFRKSILMGKIAMPTNKAEAGSRIKQDKGVSFTGQKVSAQRLMHVSDGALHSGEGGTERGVDLALYKKCEEIEGLCVQLFSKLQVVTLIVGALMLLNIIFIGATLFLPKLDCGLVTNEMNDRQEAAGFEPKKEISAATNTMGEVANVQSNGAPLTAQELGSTPDEVKKATTTNPPPDSAKGARRKEDE